MRRACALIAALALAALPMAASAQGPVDLEAMAATNALYEDGRYEQAARSFQQLVDKGYGDPVLYYNLGNAYFKQGDIGRAILNYLRAERLAPRDDDIRANLDFARSQTLDLLESGEAPFVRFVTGLLFRVTAGELGAVALTLWLLFAACLLLLIVGPRSWLAWDEARSPRDRSPAPAGRGFPGREALCGLHKPRGGHSRGGGRRGERPRQPLQPGVHAARRG